MSSVSASTALIVLLVVLPACRGEEAASLALQHDTAAAPDTVWEETTVPYDPECAEGCVEVDRLQVGHLGEITLLRNPDVDDPVAQWGDCIDSFAACALTDSAASPVRDCVQQARCPDVCKAEFDRRSAGVQDSEALLDTFETIFIDEGAVCRPREG